MHKKISDNKELVNEIINFYLVPNSLNATAKHFKKDKRVIKKVLSENNIFVQPRIIKETDFDYTKESEQKVVEFYLQPNSAVETAKKFNISRNHVYKILKTNNILLHDVKVNNKFRGDAVKKYFITNYGVENP